MSLERGNTRDTGVERLLNLFAGFTTRCAASLLFSYLLLQLFDNLLTNCKQRSKQLSEKLLNGVEHLMEKWVERMVGESPRRNMCTRT